MVARTTLLVLSVVCFALFAAVATFVIAETRQGYGIELRVIGFGAGFAATAFISLGCWLFLKGK
ncbi:MAG: hypothetical protein ACLPLR_16120 [Terriglobales bacterium]